MGRSKCRQQEPSKGLWGKTTVRVRQFQKQCAQSGKPSKGLWGKTTVRVALVVGKLNQILSTFKGAVGENHSERTERTSEERKVGAFKGAVGENHSESFQGEIRDDRAALQRGCGGKPQ